MSEAGTTTKKRLRLPPVKDVSLCWENIKVQTKAGRPLLNGIDGAALPGQLVALMGASGAGKTTLLNTLLHRNLKGLHVEGDILLDGRPIVKGSIGSVSAYVQQEDLFIGTLTVREHLNIQADLRLHNKMSAAARKERVEAVLHEIGLTNSQYSRIGLGGVKKGISGGEAKRLAFAAEILSNPALLFCDEPTTGLDSFMALQVIHTLNRMAVDGKRTIVCTIHQPASEIYEMFDKVLFLALGRVAFFGTPAESLIFFNKSGVLFPSHCNPADILIHNLAVIPFKEEECTTKITKICDNFQISSYNEEVLKWRAECKARVNETLSGRGNVPLLRRLWALLKRSLIDTFRNPSLARAKIVQKAVMGLFIGLLYFRTDMNQDGVQSFKGALFYYISEITYATVFGIQTFMPNDFPVVAREHHDGIYPVGIYYTAKILSYLPLFTLDGMIMLSISYFMVGFDRNILSFLRTIVTGVLIEWSAASMGLMISAASPSYAIAVSISGPLLTMFSLTGGLFTNVGKMSPYVSWVQYLSWFRYGYESFVINQFRHIESIPCEDASGKPTTACESSGGQIIRNLYFDEANLYWNWAYMLIYILCAFVIGYSGLLLRTKLAR
uniref:ABC transporter domain-containing protein n=1 Tax=Panagrellus redivivus TaxID=6233 RepID=A0A7E4V193_PANRE